MNNKWITLLACILTSVMSYSQTWELVGTEIVGTDPGGQTGFSVDISDNDSLIIVGSPYHLNTGLGEVYEWDGTDWIQKGSDILPSLPSGKVGYTVDISGDGSTIALGHDDYAGYSGYLEVYEWDGSDWATKGTPILPTQSPANNGYSFQLSEDGSRIVVSSFRANSPNGNEAGVVNTYEYNGTDWQKMGDSLSGEVPFDYFGVWVRMNPAGDEIAVCAYASNEITFYAWDGSAWMPSRDTLFGGANTIKEKFEWSNDGNTLVAGGRSSNVNGGGAGEATAHYWDGSAWQQRGPAIYGMPSNLLGWGLDISGDGSRIAVGAYGSDWSYNYGGRVEVYDWDGSNWIGVGDTIEGIQNNDRYGYDVELSASGNLFIAGAPRTLSASTTGRVEVRELCDLDNSVSMSGVTLSASQAGATYQWLDCENAFAPISGATGQQFTPTENGNYAVAVTSGLGCTDTSACMTVSSVGIVENDFASELLVFPNPTNGSFSIDLGARLKNASITMTDITGKVLLSNTYQDSQVLHLNMEAPAGVYVLTIESAERRAVVRVIKE